MRPRVLAVGFLLAALAPAIGACNRTPAAPAQPPPITYTGLDELRARLDANRDAGRVSVMHLWGTWCGPCIEEFPRLARMHRRIAAEKRIDFFAVALDESSLEGVERFVRQSGAGFPVLVADTPDPRAFTKAISPRWPGVIPTTFVYGPDGAMAIEHIGEVEDDRHFEKQIRELLESR